MRSLALFFLLGCGAAGADPSEGKRPIETATPSAVWFKGEVYCPPGTVYEGTVCKPLVVLDCPAGTKFKDGVGCLALQPSAPPPPPSGGPSFTSEPPPTPSNGCRSCPPGDLACALRCQQRPPGFELPPAAVPQGGSRLFDRGAASRVLSDAAASAKTCPSRGEVATAKVTLTFLPSGRADGVMVGPPFADTDVGDCIRRIFADATVPPFTGGAVSVSKTITQ